jgi:GAF domain-containing protein/CHASE3 domain sensor protein
MLVASAVLAVVVGAAFVALLVAVRDVRNAERKATRSQEVLLATNALERLLLDLETGQRGFLLTHQDRFLEPWTRARRTFPQRVRTLLGLVAGDRAAELQARRIARAEQSYITDYSIPLVSAARRDDPAADSVGATATGKRRVDAIRGDFDVLINAERSVAARADARVTDVSRRTLLTAVIGLAGSIALIALYAGYLMRAIVRPVRRASAMAVRLAGGDLSARMPETGAGEIGALERAFNVMGSSLEHGRDELAALAEEQAALRRVATLVARGVPPEQVFSAVAEEIARLTGADIAKVLRFESDATATVVGGWSVPGMHIPIGTRLTVLGQGVAVTVLETGEPARTERFDGPPGSVADCFRRTGARAGAGSPIVVEGRLWGVAIAATAASGVLEPGTELRIAGFTELVATAIANTQTRAELRRVAEEQAALRRVATLVAEGVAPSTLFATVAEEVRNVLAEDDLALVGRYDDGSIELVGGSTRDGEAAFVGSRVPLGGRNVATLVHETKAAARVDDLEDDASPASTLAREFARSSAGAPINVEGRLWGVITVASTSESALPFGIEHRLAEFTDLVATAIANSQARAELSSLAADQAALRRVATLVARAAPPEEVFAAVAAEVGQLLHADRTWLGRYDSDRTVGVAAWRNDGVPAHGESAPHRGGRNITSIVFETGKPARLDSYDDASGEAGEYARSRNLRSAVGAPVLVENRVWGVIIAASTGDQRFPPDAETRVVDFTELVATAIANAHTRDELHRAADEQAALRRVATLVAEGTAPPAVFAAVAEEMADLLPGDLACVVRFEPDRTATVVAICGTNAALAPVGTPVPFDPIRSVTTRVRISGKPSRIDDYDAPNDALAKLGIRSAVAAPIAVEGQLWGAITTFTTRDEQLPPETDERLEAFTFLAATAIANAKAVEELRRVAGEQAALRRVATLVAEGVAPSAVFAAVAEEIEGLLPADIVTVFRYDADGGATIVAMRGQQSEAVSVGTRLSVEQSSITTRVRESGRPVRIDDYASDSTSVSVALGVRSAVAAPIAVEGRLWGGVGLASTRDESLPRGAEERLGDFTELSSASSRSPCSSGRRKRRCLPTSVSSQRSWRRLRPGSPVHSTSCASSRAGSTRRFSPRAASGRR